MLYEVITYLEDEKKRFENINDSVWDYAELKFDEFKSKAVV